MQVNIKKDGQNSVYKLRRLGYVPHVNKQGQKSFVRHIYREAFPRFHLYINKEDETILYCAIHLDQKRPSYQGTTAHGGDYDSPEVQAEIERMGERNK